MKPKYMSITCMLNEVISLQALSAPESSQALTYNCNDSFKTAFCLAFIVNCKLPFKKLKPVTFIL